MLIDPGKWSKGELLQPLDSLFSVALAAAAISSLWSPPGLPTPGGVAGLEVD